MGGWTLNQMGGWTLNFFKVKKRIAKTKTFKDSPTLDKVGFGFHDVTWIIDDIDDAPVADVI
jgi:hypothetical protein